MTLTFFECLTPESKARLMQYYWDAFGRNLVVPDTYKQIINAPEYEEDHIKEINEEMSRPSHSHKDRG